MKIYRQSRGVKVTLRKATDEDILSMELKYPEDKLLPLLSSLESWVLVSGSNPNGEPIGFIEYLVRDDEAFVTGLWVSPGHRGNGYGTMMLEILEATEQPYFIRVLTTPDSASFYEDRGYTYDEGLAVLTRAVRYEG